MTGSSLVPVIVPIVAVLAMAVWLGLVFYAAAHPRWKRYDVLPEPTTGADSSSPGAPERAGQAPVRAGQAPVRVGQAPERVGQARPAAAPRRAA